MQELERAEEDIVTVGHLPFLGTLASTLVTGAKPPVVVSLRQGGIFCIDRSGEKAWRMAWMLILELLM